MVAGDGQGVEIPGCTSGLTMQASEWTICVKTCGNGVANIVKTPAHGGKT